MKVIDTVELYRTSRSRLANKLHPIVIGMNDEVREAFQSSISEYCTSEIFLYGDLLDRGLDGLFSARTAVLYPNPLEFHPLVKNFSPNTKVQDFYFEKLTEGVNPILVLKESLDLVEPYHISRYVYEQRKIRFLEFIALQS